MPRDGDNWKSFLIINIFQVIFFSFLSSATQLKSTGQPKKRRNRERERGWKKKKKSIINEKNTLYEMLRLSRMVSSQHRYITMLMVYNGIKKFGDDSRTQLKTRYWRWTCCIMIIALLYNLHLFIFVIQFEMWFFFYTAYADNDWMKEEEEKKTVYRRLLNEEQIKVGTLSFFFKNLNYAFSQEQRTPHFIHAYNTRDNICI